MQLYFVVNLGYVEYNLVIHLLSPCGMIKKSYFVSMGRILIFDIPVD